MGLMGSNKIIPLFPYYNSNRPERTDKFKAKGYALGNNKKIDLRPGRAG